MLKHLSISLAALGLAVGTLSAQADFGAATEKNLLQLSIFRHGVSNDIGASATAPEGFIRDRSRSAADLIKLSDSLNAEFLTRDAANWTDMMVLFPAQNPSHIITCVEERNPDLPDGRKAPSVQTIDLATGEVNTVLRGMIACDGIRLTAWGTILATEEAGDGGAYEIIDPLNTFENTVVDRATGQITGATAGNIAKRPALPTMAWEGLTVLFTGVVIAGDELRPGTDGDDTDGGAIFKFVPENPNTLQSITDLSQSPFVAGSVYALRVSCRDNRPQFGQGCEVGSADWVGVNAATARADANANGATGYYRPEDLHRDPSFLGQGVRFCWANTGLASGGNYGEVMCAIDSAPNQAAAGELTVMVNRFIEGTPDMNQPDNLAFQPGTGILYVIEDNPNGDVWACLPDGDDRDIKSDGCIKVMSVVDASAEPTGLFFSDDGKTAYLSIQHSDDAEGTQFDGFDTDDVLRITGFATPIDSSTLDGFLNLGAGSIAPQAGNVLQMQGIQFNGVPLNANIKINMDGTWELR
ncbi:MAG: DUF839 domain-containing protein [Methylococcales bacterium]|nr:DUF839 domain-containing protein [Methylococcales bacterium]